MMVIVRNLSFFFLVQISWLAAQPVTENFIITDYKQGGIHHLETGTINLVVRANYSYDVFLVNGDDGIFGCLISKDGAISEKGDEIIFVNSDNMRKNFVFGQHPTKSSQSGRPIYRNHFTVDHEGLEWLIDEKPVQFYLKNTVLHQMRKYSLPQSRRQLFVELIQQFVTALDPQMTNQPTIVRQRPIVKNDKQLVTQRRSDVSDDSEIRDLVRQKADIKKSLLAEIEQERKSVEKIKEGLRNEVLEARIQTNQIKDEYSQEVLQARKNSLSVIQEIRKATDLEVAEQQRLSEQKREAYAQSVHQARIKSVEALTKIEIESEKKLAEHQNQLITEIKQSELNYQKAQKAYSKEIQAAKVSSRRSIVNIRERTSKNIDSLHQAYLNTQINLTQAQQSKFQKENSKLKIYQEIIIDSLGKMEEALVRKKESFAQEIANERIKFNEKLNSLQKEHSLTISDKQKEAEAKILASKQNLLIESKRYKNTLDEYQIKIAITQNQLKVRLDSLHITHDQKIIANRHLLEKTLQEIANDIITAKERSKDMLLKIKTESQYDISTIQNIVREQRDELMASLLEERKKISTEKERLNNIQLEIKAQQLRTRDSLKQTLVADIILLNKNYNKAVKRIRHNKDSILTYLDQQYHHIQRAYADSIKMTTQKARNKIAEIREQQQGNTTKSNKESEEQISLIEENKIHQQRVLKEREQMAQEILKIRKDHQLKLSEMHERLDSQIQFTFRNVNEVKSAYRDEMNIMSSQLAAYKTKHQQKLLEENESFGDLLSLTRNKQLSDLLKLDSSYQAKKSSILFEHAAEIREITVLSTKRLRHLRDSLRADYQTESNHLQLIVINTKAKRDSLHKQEREILSEHKKKIIESQSDMLDALTDHEETLTNEVYQARQKAREAIALTKSNTLKEINDIIASKKQYEEELKKLESLIEQKKSELKSLEKKEK